MQNDNSQEQNPIDAQAAALLPEGASEAQAEAAPEDEAYKPSKPEFKWYVVQTYSSMENAVERSIQERVARSN